MTPMPTTRNTVRTLAVGLLATGLHSAAGCHTVCPASLSIATPTGMLVGNANTGVPSEPSTVWSFHAESPVAPLSLLGPVISRPPGFIFRTQFGATGEIVQIFDNELMAPERLGDMLVLDNRPRSTAQPPVMYAGESYGVGIDNAVYLTICNQFFVGPLTLVKVRIEFEGTLNALLGRMDGTLRFVIEPGAVVGWLPPPPPVQAETIEVSAFALRETEITPPTVPGGLFPWLPFP
jgi:hypothetical protein